MNSPIHTIRKYLLELVIMLLKLVMLDIDPMVPMLLPIVPTLLLPPIPPPTVLSMEDGGVVCCSS